MKDPAVRSSAPGVSELATDAGTIQNTTPSLATDAAPPAGMETLSLGSQV